MQIHSEESPTLYSDRNLYSCLVEHYCILFLHCSWEQQCRVASQSPTQSSQASPGMFQGRTKSNVHLWQCLLRLCPRINNQPLLQMNAQCKCRDPAPVQLFAHCSGQEKAPTKRCVLNNSQACCGLPLHYFRLTHLQIQSLPCDTSFGLCISVCSGAAFSSALHRHLHQLHLNHCLTQSLPKPIHQLLHFKITFAFTRLFAISNTLHLKFGFQKLVPFLASNCLTRASIY